MNEVGVFIKELPFTFPNIATYMDVIPYLSHISNTFSKQSTRKTCSVISLPCEVQNRRHGRGGIIVPLRRK